MKGIKFDKSLLLGAIGFLIGIAADMIQQKQIELEISEQLDERLGKKDEGEFDG